MARLSALGMAITVHSVLGISYYFLLGKCSPAPLLGSWLFVACIVAILQAVHIVPQWSPNSSILFELLIETTICCLTLDLMLTKLWCRIESLCHCAIVGVLQAYVTEEQTFAACEYWLLGTTTTVIASCLLWFTLWATALPTKMRVTYDEWRERISRSFQRNLTYLVFGPVEGGMPRVEQNDASAISFAE
ncbi:uncharacterized protein LOC115627945 [Scaptodrosophila lebanonensis]|uniref:Uncharacterized protein LOC115627945 n=1 Tax=Drosophila lebanonensis TaxID=7225 RepID=A0A6J2TX10_DROLE|nr:uncharacterized protein LOC115627945 [Scaptodrosophila lebanonensis]